ncbi:MAG TPA: hypothetical protein VFT50_11540 [Baekduia sp.]|nr:hypothetical protein [Baekduia sp.]
MTSHLHGLTPLCDWARCFNCGQSRPASDTSIPTCCAVPLVISAWTPAPRAVQLTAVADDGLNPATRRVLDALISAGPKGRTTAELCQPDVGGERFSARLHELRQAGWTIHGRCERQGSWRYTIDLARQEKAA